MEQSGVKLMDVDDDREDVFFCDGCGKVFPVEERANEGDPICVRCWEAETHDGDDE